MDNLTLSTRQFVQAWQTLCAAAPGYRRETVPGVEYIFSGVPVGFFNVAMATARGDAPRDLAQRAEQARTWASGAAVPWFFIVTPETEQEAADAVTALDGAGFVPVLKLTGMRAERVDGPARIPDGLTLQVPEDDPGCVSLVDVNAAAYGMSLESGAAVWGRRAFWAEHCAVLGLASGKPVSCAAALMVDGYRYVAWVATHPDYQRRGYADAVMRQALELSRAAHGEKPTFLHATDAGRPIYERMGYETVANHVIFMDKAFLGEH